MASFTTGPNGQIIASAGPPLHIPSAQTITGGPINAAATKTIAAQAQQVEAAKALGAGQKGSSRRRRRRHRGGATNLNASIPFMPTANSIPGVSATNNHLNAVNNLNQIRADSVYDSLHNAPPLKVGGFRLREAEELYPMSGTQEDTKRVRRIKKKHGRRNNRTHRRGNRKSSTRSRRRNRSVH
jgi:hypothetical protein